LASLAWRCTRQSVQSLQDGLVDGARSRGVNGHEAIDSLTRSYDAYRRRHAERLVRMVPREAVRDLYAEARDWANAAGIHDRSDPMSTLQSFAEHLLPLPTFEVWLSDRAHGPLRHIEDGEGDGLATPSSPAKVDERRFAYDGRSWLASLYLYRDGERWRGFLQFRGEGGERLHRTASILLEETARQVRRSFRGFDGVALGAFLRSALPEIGRGATVSGQAEIR